MPSTPESTDPSDSTADGSSEDLAGLSFEEIFNTGPLIAMGAIPEDLAFVIASREIFDSAVHQGDHN